MRRIPVVALTALLVTAGAACSSSGKTTSNTATTTGQASGSPTTEAGPYTLNELDATLSFLNVPTYAVQHSTGSQYNLTVTEASVTGGGAANQEFAGGQSDLLVAGVDSPIRLMQNGTADVTVIASISKTNVWVLVSKKGSPYTTLQSLKGKNVGISGPGAVSDIALREQFKAQGMNPDTDVHLVALGAPAAQLAALENGTAQAVQLVAPVLQAQLASGAIQIVDDMRTQPYASLVITARTSAIKAHPGAYCAYESALKTAMNKLMTDTTYATQMASAEWGTTYSASQIQTMLQEYTQDHWVADTAFTQAQYDATKNILLSSGQFNPTNFPTFSQLTQNAPSC